MPTYNIVHASMSGALLAGGEEGTLGQVGTSGRQEAGCLFPEGHPTLLCEEGLCREGMHSLRPAREEVPGTQAQEFAVGSQVLCSYRVHM